MATTGTFAFNPTFADHLDEAFERAGMNPAKLTVRHALSTAFGAELMLADWYNRGFKQWTIEKASQTTTTGMQSFTMPDGAIDIFHAALTRDGLSTEIYPISRSDYNALHDITIEGRPDKFFVERADMVGAAEPTVFIYRAGENVTDIINYYYIRRIEEIGDAGNTIDLPAHWFEAFSAGMAVRIAEKWNSQRFETLRVQYEGQQPDVKLGGALGRAFERDRERAPLVIRVSGRRHRGK